VYTVTVRVTDDGASALDDFETIQITVNEVNIAPVAAADTYTTPEDTVLSVAAPGLLDNDSDADLPAQTLNAVLDTPPAGDWSGRRLLRLHPNAGLQWPVTFTYFANDGVENSAPTW
jgi:hypothetical protein